MNLREQMKSDTVTIGSGILATLATVTLNQINTIVAFLVGLTALAAGIPRAITTWKKFLGKDSTPATPNPDDDDN